MMGYHATVAFVVTITLAGCAETTPICCSGGYEYRHTGRTIEEPKPDGRDAKIAAREQERQQQVAAMAQMRSQVEDLERKLATPAITPVAQAYQSLRNLLKPEIARGNIWVALEGDQITI